MVQNAVMHLDRGIAVFSYNFKECRIDLVVQYCTLKSRWNFACENTKVVSGFVFSFEGWYLKKIGASETWDCSEMKCTAVNLIYFIFWNRYRHEFQSNELWREIKYVLGEFAAPLTQLFSVRTVFDMWWNRIWSAYFTVAIFHMFWCCRVPWN